MDSKINPALEKYAELMIQKIKEVNSNWERPWFSSQFKGFPQNLSGRQYNNYNKLLLYILCDRENYTTPIFLTFQQAQKENILIRKGSKSFPISYYDLDIKNISTGERVTKEFYNELSKLEKKDYRVIPFMKYFNVFNLDQTNFAEKYPERWETLKKQVNHDGYRNNLIDKTIENQSWVCPIELKVQSDAFYSPVKDSITLPTMQQFPNGKEFYYTALHEMAHSTGHPERLDRKFGYSVTPAYAKEELIAELSSAVAGKDLGFAVLPRKENAQYLKGWLTAITDDPKYIYGILQDVNKAVTMIEEGIGLKKEIEETKEISIPTMTEDEYIASKGYEDSSHSKSPLYQGIRSTPSQQNPLPNFSIKESQKDAEEYNAIKGEYHKMLDKGEIRQPTRRERIIKAANGDPELKSTQEARRIAFAEKINWQSQNNNLPAIYQYYYDNSQQLHAKFYQDGKLYDRFVWQSDGNYIICTGSRAEGNYVEHSLPPEEVFQIKRLNQIEIQSSGCRTLLSDYKSSIESQKNTYCIFDESTGKTEPLHISEIDLNKQSPESIKKLLSGQQTEMITNSGLSQIVGLQKTPAGWGIQIGKQTFSSADSSAEI